MNDVLDRLLTETMEDLASGPPPAGLAAGAIRRARRQRATRLGVAAVALAVVGTAAAVPFTVGGGTDPTPPDGPAMAAPKAMVITAYSGITRNGDPGPADIFSAVLDPETGRYTEIDYSEATPSPVDRRLLVATGDNSPVHPSRAAILNMATGGLRWISGYGGYDGYLNWSPDGRQALYTRRPKTGGAGFVVVDTTTLKETFVPVPDATQNNAMGLGFVWAPDGKSVALTLSKAAGDEARPDAAIAVRFYSLDGRPLRTVAQQHGALRSTVDFSPDGSAMALSDPHANGDVVVVDVATGAERARIPADGAGPTVVGWYDDNHLVLTQWTERDASTGTARVMMQVVDLTGKPVRGVPLMRETMWAATIHIGPADALDAALADKIAF